MQAICIDWENAFYTVFHNKVLNVHTDAVSLCVFMFNAHLFYSNNVCLCMVFSIRQVINNNVKTDPLKELFSLSSLHVSRSEVSLR